jgi:succinoglycan biosynthesis transport protein ExoP
MLDIKDFSIFESEASFDFKGLLVQIGSYWRWFLLSLIITRYGNINIGKRGK